MITVFLRVPSGRGDSSYADAFQGLKLLIYLTPYFSPVHPADYISVR
jgi:hypothetical protein